MKDYMISEIKYGKIGGGVACGPIGGYPIAEAKFIAKDGEIFYISYVNVDGIPQFYKTDISTLDKQIELFDDVDKNEEFWDELNTHYMGIGDFSDVYKLDEGDDLKKIFRCMIHIQEAEGKCNFEGKYFSEIEIPISESEQEWIEDFEEE